MSHIADTLNDGISNTPIVLNRIPLMKGKKNPIEKVADGAPLSHELKTEFQFLF
jgi:hypothetical protein